MEINPCGFSFFAHGLLRLTPRRFFNNLPRFVRFYELLY